jgi:hypothetical protein
MQLAQFAPGIIKLLSGSDKAEEVASKVIDVAKAITGTGSGAAAVAAIQADPQKMLDFQLAVGAQQLDWERIYLADTQNSRGMQVTALGQDDLFSKRFVYYFASAWSAFTMVYVAAITFWPPIEESGKANSATVLGFLLGTAVASIFSYLFGNNRNSQKKDDTINKLSAS